MTVVTTRATGESTSVLSYRTHNFAPTGGADNFPLGLITPPENNPGDYLYMVAINIDGLASTATLKAVTFNCTTPEGNDGSFTVTDAEGWFVNNGGSAVVYIPAFQIPIKTGTAASVDITMSAANGTIAVHVSIVCLGPH